MAAALYKKAKGSKKQVQGSAAVFEGPHSSFGSFSLTQSPDTSHLTQNVNDDPTTSDIVTKRMKLLRNDLNRKGGKIAKQLRVKLPGISDYDREKKFQAQAPPRVMLRLERVIGTNQLNITNNRYMTTLSTKIDEEEKDFWQKRVSERKKSEKQRQRQLVFDGIVEPPPATNALYAHPIFRVNRIMRRIGQLRYDNADSSIPPPINITEPFEEQNRTGYLFGTHKQHYLNVPPSQTPPPTKTSSSPLEQEFLTPVMRRLKFSAKTTRYPQVSVATRKNQIETEGIDAESEEVGGALQTETLAELLRRQSLVQARRYFGLDEGKLKKDFEIEKPIHVQKLFLQSKDELKEMYDYSSNLLRSYRLAQYKTDDFCSKNQRKLFK